MSDFRVAAEAVHAAGYTYFDQLGRRPVAGGIEIWLRVVNPATHQAQLIRTTVVATDGAAPGDAALAGVSVADLWGGARWAELEIRRAGALLTPSGGVAHPEEPR